MHLTDAAAENRSILAVNIHTVTIDRTIAGDHTIRRCCCRIQVKIGGTRSYSGADLNETFFIEQGIDPIAR